MDLNSAIILKRYKKQDQPKLIRAYTINDESRYLLITNVPKLGVVEELLELLQQYGNIIDWCQLTLPDMEPFTEMFWFKYETFEQARLAKNKLDDAIFYSQPLWVSYAPQYETIEDTKLKLLDRMEMVKRKIKGNID
ncbi:hypothetical protein K502DRAFT_342453 [Neoconidiobolus thromboides FSU 785]|nr:hypothetical protein K502DRAFT_342453 [Neoconidiobolus thromboides FSU 785]